MKKAVSLIVITAFAAALVAVPPSKPAEAGSAEAALGLAAFAAGAIILNAIFAKPAPAAVIYPAPQVAGAPPALYPQPGVYGSRGGGLTVASAAPFPVDYFVNGQLMRAGAPAGEVINLQVYGSGLLLARAADGSNKFAERSFFVGNGGAQVVLHASDFR